MFRQNSSSSSAAVAASSRWRWQLMLFGLFYIVMQCDARAVNVSNTWTMPQEGLNVFYRFFRDRISWFEADAVCQFHHANLVTVDNSFQFDATRDLLRELDVNDIVWIGLMRPQSSDRFMWSSNSRPLVADTGYWAESLPLMDAPLCAVIDPIRDYRWHALRCGGPETASFLCEMPVPNWADTCILKDMPNLTMQYMADTASIELIRNCQEEGLLMTKCRGKQDRDRALQDLICPRERLEAQRINDITNSHFKSLQIINSIPSDNNENNDIELLPMEINYGASYPEEVQTEKNTVQRLIEQFNVDELMQADEPANMETVSSFYKIPGLIPKPVKKSAKKVVEYPKKDANKKVVILQDTKKDKTIVALEMDDMMLGDQPQGEPEMPEQLLNEEVSNEIMEPLPHIKKTNIHKEDMEKMEKEVIAMKENMQKSKEMEAKKWTTTSTTTTTTTEAATTTTTEVPTTTTTEAAPVTTTTQTASSTANPTTQAPRTSASTQTSQPTTTESSKTTDTTPKLRRGESTTEGETPTVRISTTIPPATIGHPMHPQQQRSNVIITEESQHPHVKESPDNSHFIPPMLLVKSHYVPPTNKHVHNDHHSHTDQHLDVTTTNEDLTEMTKIKTGNNEMMATTPKVIDLDQTIMLKGLDTTNDKQHHPQRQRELKHYIAQSAGERVVQTEGQTSENGNMKPITQENKKNIEQKKLERKNSKYMNLEQALPATSTATTTAAPLSTTMLHKLNIGERGNTTLQTSTQKFVKGNGRSGHNDNRDDDDAPQEAVTDVATTHVDMALAKAKTSTTTKNAAQNLKPQTDTETETMKKTTKLVKATTRTVTTIRAKDAAPAGASAASAFEETTEQKQDLVTESTQPATTAKQMEYVKETVEKSDLALTQQQPNMDREQQQYQAATQKPDLTFATTATTEQATETTKAARRLILATDIQATQKTETSGEMNYNDEGIVTEEANEGSRDKKETFGTTEVLTTKSSATAIATTSVGLSTSTPAATATATTTTTKTTTTTVVPATDRNTNSSISNSSNTPTEVTEGSTTTTKTFISSTTTAPSTIVAANLTPSESSPAPGQLSTTSTAAPTPLLESSPETTRNFLKVSTEMPYKPNRRRSLTKPETVSYMKKMLG